MFLEKFAAMVFSLLAAFGGEKYAGNSPYSFELAPRCGSDKLEPLCPLEPTCGIEAWRCAPPRWSDARGGWVVPETKEHAYGRYQKIAESISRVSFLHARCRDEWGVVLEGCEPSGWPTGPRSLAMVAATTALWESGLREDIMFGHAPMGRGAMGETCLMQVMPNQIRQFASWIPEDELEVYDKLPLGKERGEWDEVWAKRMLGDSPEALDRCFDVGLRALARARWACASRQSNGGWAYKMWAMYGTGSKCSSFGIHDDFAAKRASTYHRMKSFRPESGNNSAWPVPEPVAKN
ncbi:MAG: hypothetical protein ACOC1F_10315 [Myxococcota bacterium]